MSRLLLLFLLFVTFAPSAGAGPDSPITAEQGLRDLRILKHGLTQLHPGAWRYITPAQLNAEFERANAAVAGGTDRATMYLLASRIAAALRCGHTWTNYLNQSDAVKTELFGRADKLPLTLRLVERRLLIIGSAVDGIDAGSELLAIDGRPAKQLVDELLPYLRADGSSDGKRRAQIDSGVNGGAMDRLFPLLHAPVDQRYALRIRDAHGGERTQWVAATTVAERDKVLAALGTAEPSEDWRFAIDGDTATMTLPTFAFWNGQFDGIAWIDEAFARLRKAKTPYLIIDIRRNEGGDDALGKHLLAELLHQPYTQPRQRVESAYERVPYELARYLDTWDFRFFDRTGQVVKGDGRNWLLKDQPPPARIEPSAAVYAGRTILLVGPDDSSAGYLLARDMKFGKAATLVGRTTGGNLRGLNGGQLAWMTLPASGVAVDIPLLAAMTLDNPPDAGVEPDIAVRENFTAAAAGVDVDLRAARRIISRWKHGAAGSQTSAKDL